MIFSRIFPSITLATVVLCVATAQAQNDFGRQPPRRQPPPGRGGFGGFGFDGGSGKRLAPTELDIKDGAAEIKDHAAYQKLSYKGPEVMIDTFLANLEFVKFTLEGAAGESPQLYFINTNTHRAHMMFGRVAGLPRSRGGDQMKGVLVYRPMLKSPSGQPGLFTFEFEPFDTYSFKMVKIAHDHLVSKMPSLKGNIGYYPRQRGIEAYERDKALYEKAGLPVYLEKDLINNEVAYLPLNAGVSFGLLRQMAHDQRPSPRDIVIYKSLPNELSRVAGVMTEVRQTPLSHVNLRAVQDGIPNAFISEAAKNKQIKPLLGQLVRFEVTHDGFRIRKATASEVESSFKNLRPSKTQIPKRDLSIETIRPLDEVQFVDSQNVGVKAANLAAMHSFGFPAGTIPQGHAIPFYFYDQFMKHNGFYEYIDATLKKPEFKKSREVQEAELKKFRSLIKDGRMPDTINRALNELHASYPKGSSLRCRSSTNNEDLPGFSGAGLYGSYTHRPEEGPLAKSIKQVFASTWNFRAFEEREFYRVDHLATAMGVLVHPNYKSEQANGVAVTDDILYQTLGNYYLNVQVGEDLVTNPEAESIPEEILLGWWERDGHRIMQRSSQIKHDDRLLSDEQLNSLRSALAKVHARFAKLYGKSKDEIQFAMEVEFKVAKDGNLVIKQARPWVFPKTQPTNAAK